jgi:hypothetical protein
MCVDASVVGVLTLTNGLIGAMGVMARRAVAVSGRARRYRR